LKLHQKVPNPVFRTAPALIHARNTINKKALMTVQNLASFLLPIVSQGIINGATGKQSA
jgi:hypothetical protein